MNTICNICNQKVFTSRYGKPTYIVETVCCKRSACNVCLYRYMELYCDTVRNYVVNDENIPDGIVGCGNYVFTNHCMYCKKRWSNDDLFQMFNRTHLEKEFYEIIKQLYSTIESYWSLDVKYRNVVFSELSPLIKDVAYYCSSLKISTSDVPMIRKIGGNYKCRASIRQKWYRCTSDVIDRSRDILLNKCGDNSTVHRSVDRLFDSIEDVASDLDEILSSKDLKIIPDIGMDTLSDTLDSGIIDWKLVEYLRCQLKLTTTYETSMTIDMRGQFHEFIWDIYRLRAKYIEMLGPDIPKYTQETLSKLRYSAVEGTVVYNQYRKEIKQYITKIHDQAVHYDRLFRIIDILTIALVDYSNGSPYYQVVDRVISDLGNGGFKDTLDEFCNASILHSIKYYTQCVENASLPTDMRLLDFNGQLHTISVHTRKSHALLDTLWYYDPYIQKLKEHDSYHALLTKYYKYRSYESSSIPNNSTGYWSSIDSVASTGTIHVSFS